MSHSDEPEHGNGEERVTEEVLARPSWLRDMPYYATSAVLHLILVGVLLCWVIPSRQEGPDSALLKVRQARERPQYDPTRPRDTKRTPTTIARKPVDLPVQNKIEVETEIPKGIDLTKMSDTHLDGDLANAAIGLGGGLPGAYGKRFERGRLPGGGPPGAEDAVLAALHWLRRHQSADGSWKCHDFTEMCPRTRCANINTDYGDGRGFSEHDVGVTGLAMLAFTGYAHTHKDGEYPEFVHCLRNAASYLKRIQVKSSDPATNGRYGPGDHEQWIYDHSIATMAMSELLVMSRDVFGLKRSVRDAVTLCLRAQNDGRGWRYGVKPGDNDTSVTGWMVLALKTAKDARLGIPKAEFDRAFAGALKWFDYATAANGKTGYFVPGDEGSRLAKGHPTPYPYSKELSCMTAVGILCRIFAGQSRRDPAIKDGAHRILLPQPPRWQEKKGRSLSKINMYYWYYGSYALFQFGGKAWQTWNKHMQEALLDSQRNLENGNEDVDGSWDPIGEWGVAGGRVYSTAIGAMTLEVFYRFRRLQEGTAF